MKTFKQLNAKEKILYLGIMLLYPLILLYDYIGKYIKFFSIRKRQITASILTVCLMLTMIPLAAITAFAAVGSITNYGTMTGKWNGNITTNLINIPAIGSGTSFWEGTMMPAGWSSKGISGTDTNLDVYRTTALDGTTDTFAIRPVNGGGTLNGGDACLGGADETPVRGAGVSYTVKLDSKAQKLANEGVLTTTSKAEFYKQNLYYYELGITIVFYNSAGSELSAVGAVPTYSESSATNKITKEVDEKGVHCGWYQTTGAGDGYLSRWVSNVKVPAGTVYIRYWYANRGTGNDRKAVKNMQAYLITPHSTGHPNWTEYKGSKSETSLKKDANIVLSGDTTFSGNLTVGDGTNACIVNLCLNGYTLDMQSQQIEVKSGAELHLCDCQATGVLKSAIEGGTVIVNSGGNLHFSSGNIKNTASADGSCINIKTGGSVKMSGGSITGNIYGVENRGTFTITDGVVKGDSRGLNNRGTTTISGGTVTGSSAIYNYADYTLNLSGGTVKGTSFYAINNSGTAYIYGSPSILGEKADLYVSNAIHVENAKGTTDYTGDALTINVGSPAVDKVVVNNVTDQNSTYFSVINEGYTLKTSGENLVLTLSHIHTGVEGEFTELTDWSQLATSGKYYLGDTIPAVSGNIEIASGANITLCLNGKTLDMGEYYINNKGTLNICDCGEGGEITSTITSSSSSPKGTVTNNGTLTMTGGHISNASEASGSKFAIVNKGTAANATITGGKVTTASEAIYNYGAYYATTGPSLTLGGTLVVESTNTAVRNAYGTVNVDGGTYTSTDSYGVSNNGSESFTAVMTITDANITGETGITNGLYTNLTVSGETTIIGTSSYGVTNSGTFTFLSGSITGSNRAIYNNCTGDTAFVMRGGSIVSEKSYGVYNNGGTVEISGGSVTSNANYGIYNTTYEGSNYAYIGKVTVSGGEIVGTQGIYNSDSQSIVNISGGKVTGSSTYGINNGGILNFAGGEVVGQTYGIYSRNGSIYLYGAPTVTSTNGDLFYSSGSIYAHNAESTYAYTGDGLSIYVFDTSTYNGEVIVNDVTEGNRDKFSVTNKGYALLLGTDENDDDLILHKHEALADDGNCLTAVLCSCGKEMVAAKAEHVSTGDNVATYTKKPVCDECGTEYGAKLVDSVAPKGEISIGTNRWEEFLNKVTFGLFFNKYQYIEITANDEKSGVESIQYYLSETAISFEDIKKSDIEWKTYSGRVKIEPNNKYFVYAKITDNAGNVTYIDTDGIVLDNIAPTFSVTVGSDTFDDNIGRYYFITGEKEQNYFVEDTLAGIQKVEYLDSEDELDDTELENATGWQTLNNGDMLPYQSGTSYNRYYRAIDKSGNASYVYLGVVVCYTDYNGEAFTADYIYGSKADAAVDIELDSMQTLAYRYISLFDKLTLSDGTKNYTTADGYEFYELSGKQGFGVKLTDGKLIESILQKNNTVTSITLNVKPLVTAGTDFYGDVPSALPIKIIIKPTNGEVKITSDISKTYDGTAVSAPSYEKLGNGIVTTEYKVKGADDSTYTTVAPKNAGEYTVRVRAAAAQPYKAASATRDFTISKAPLTVTAKDKTITYGDAPTNNGVTYSGFVNGEEVDVLGGTLGFDYSYERYGDVGTYEITPKGLTSNNYDITFKKGTLTVEKKKLLNLKWQTLSDSALVYSGIGKSSQVTYSGIVNNDYISLNITLYGDNVNVTEDGFYWAVTGISGTKAGNYALPDSNLKSPTYKITKKALTVTAKDKTITYGDAPSNNGVIYDGFVNNEEANVLGGTLGFDYSYAQYDDIGDNLFTITPKGLTAVNYEITFKEGKLTVNPLKLEFDWNTLSPEDLVYDGNDKKIGTTVKNQVTSGQYDVWVWLEYHGDTKNVTDEGFYAQAFSAAGEKAYNYYVDGTDKSPVYKITKATPETNFPTGFNIDTGKKLSDIDLTGFDGYTWDAPDTTVKYGVHEYSMTFTPADTQNYKAVSKMIKVTGGDITAPTGEITLKDNKWNEFLNNITFGLFFKETQSITITAADTESGIKEIAYYLATEELSIDDVKALENSKWTVYADAINVEPDNKYVVYARITDNAGNVIYINSDGIVLDSIKPVIAGVEDGKDVYGDATFTVDETYLDTVTLDGEPIEVKDGNYSVPADNKEHTIVVTDKTGNQVTYKLTVYKNYKVSFVVDGKEIEVSEIGYGKDVTLPEIPKKDGYTAKWDVDGKNITADTVITAVYEKIPQTGDSLNSWLWASLMLLSGLSIFGIMITKKRKKEAE